MDFNSIIKTGGKVDVLIRANTPQLIGKYSLGENEPYTLIKGVSINFFTSQEGTRSWADGIWLSHNENNPNRVTLYNVPLTEKVCNLIFQLRQGLKKSYTCNLTASKHSLILHHSMAFNVFVYNKERTLIGKSDLVTDRIITSDDLIDGEEYIVFYEYEVRGDAAKMYNLQSPHRAYFTLDIFAKGNDNDISSDIFMKIYKCSLVTNANLKFNEGLNDVTLSFDIIRDDKEQEKNKNYFIVE